MGCLTGMVRTIMFVFNFACVLAGIVLMAVGGVFYVSVDKYHEIMSKTQDLNINVVPSLTIAVGVLIFVIAFLGCCGALKNNSCMLILYAVILIAILVIQLAAGIYGFVQVNNNGKDIESSIKDDMTIAFSKFGNENGVKELFNSVQSQIECCGVNSSKDYENTLHTDIPPSCCGKTDKQKCSSEEIYKDGCAQKLYDVITSAIKVVAIVALVICSVELLGAIFAICLVKSN